MLSFYCKAISIVIEGKLSAMPKKGQKNLRAKPELYDEVKGRYNIALTPTAVKGLDAIAKLLGVSRSELCERIGRGIYQIKQS